MGQSAHFLTKSSLTNVFSLTLLIFKESWPLLLCCWQVRSLNIFCSVYAYTELYASVLSDTDVENRDPRIVRGQSFAFPDL